MRFENRSGVGDAVSEVENETIRDHTCRAICGRILRLMLKRGTPTSIALHRRITDRWRGHARGHDV